MTRSLVTALAFVLAALPSLASARPRVALPPFNGDPKGQVHAAVTDALNDAFSLVPRRDIDRSEDKLGLDRKLSSHDLEKLARELDVDAIVQGDVSRRHGHHLLHVRLFVHGHAVRGFKVEFASLHSKKFKSALRDKMMSEIGDDDGGGGDREARRDDRDGRHDDARPDDDRHDDHGDRHDDDRHDDRHDDHAGDRDRHDDRQADRDDHRDDRDARRDDDHHDDGDARRDDDHRDDRHDDGDARRDDDHHDADHRDDDHRDDRDARRDDNGDRDRRDGDRDDRHDGDRDHDRKRTADADNQDGPDSVTARATPGVHEQVHAANRDAIRVDLGGSATSRQLSFVSRAFTDGLGPPPGYHNSLVGGGRVDGEIYPLAFSDPRSAGAGLGLAGSFDQTASLAVTNSLQPGMRFPVLQRRWSIGARYRIVFGNSDTSPSVTFGIDYGHRTFKINRAGLMSGLIIDVPDVDYKGITPSLQFRVPLGRTAALLVGGGSMLMLGVGGIGTADEYGRARVTEGEGMAGLDFVFGKYITLRIIGEAAQVGYVFENTGAMTKNRDGNPATPDVGGAADRYYGGAATIGVVY